MSDSSKKCCSNECTHTAVDDQAVAQEYVVVDNYDVNISIAPVQDTGYTVNENVEG